MTPFDDVYDDRSFFERWGMTIVFSIIAVAVFSLFVWSSHSAQERLAAEKEKEKACARSCLQDGRGNVPLLRYDECFCVEPAAVRECE